VGAPARVIVRLVAARIFVVTLVGAAAGLILAMSSVRFIASLLYQVRATDAHKIAPPALIILAAAAVAATPAIVRATRIDPATLLRTD
jgi:putative ABC transport system permease protein